MESIQSKAPALEHGKHSNSGGRIGCKHSGWRKDIAKDTHCCKRIDECDTMSNDEIKTIKLPPFSYPQHFHVLLTPHSPFPYQTTLSSPAQAEKIASQPH